LLQREVPCLIEKPIAADLASARALAAFPHAWVGHIERFNPAIRPLRGLGVRFLQAERVSRWSPRGTDVDVVLDLMIHDIDLFHVLTGDPVVEVRSNGSAIATRGLDIAQARVETASGIVGTFTASRLSRQASRRLRLFVGGEPGEYWSVDLKERQVARLRWGDGELIEERVPVPEQDALAAQARAFLACAFGERPTDGIAPATAGEGLRALELALRIRDSAHS
jgi:predicted dehydrogenase